MKRAVVAILVTIFLGATAFFLNRFFKTAEERDVASWITMYPSLQSVEAFLLREPQFARRRSLIAREVAHNRRDAGDYARAIEDLQRTISDLERIEDQSNIKVLKREIGELYLAAGHYDEAAAIFAETKRVVGRLASQDAPKWSAVPVLFATDRACRENTFAATAAVKLYCEHKRADRLTYGTAEVTIPKVHKTGELERPGWWNVFQLRSSTVEQREKYFVLAVAEELPENEFYSRAQTMLGNSKSYERHLLLVIHGYATSFENALYRTAQLTADLNFDGAPVLYSWPSGGGLTDYAYDLDSARWSEDHLELFIQNILKNTNATKIHIVAHSMGNALLMPVLAKLGRMPWPSANLGQVILAAPDVDRRLFQKIAARFMPEARTLTTEPRFTLYAAANDRALHASSSVRRNELRAGEVGKSGPLIMNGLDTIEVSDLGLDFLALNHSTYAENKSVLGDLKALLKGEGSPDVRTPQLARHELDGGSYWKFPK